LADDPGLVNVIARVLVEEVVAALHHVKGFRGDQLRDAARRTFCCEPEKADLPLLPEALVGLQSSPAQDLVDVLRVVPAAVELEDVDAVRSEPLQALLDRVHDPGQVAGAGLRGENYLVPPPSDRLAEDLLAQAAAIAGSGVQVVQPELQPPPDR